MAKKKKKRSKQIILTKTKIALSLLTIAALYFFTKFTAPDWILHLILSLPSNFLFGTMGSMVFFGWFIVMACIIFYKESVLKKKLFMKFLLLMLIISCILNFPILENNAISPHNLWGYIWYLWLLIANYLLGGQILSIKLLYVILLILVLIWMYFSFELGFHKTKLEISYQEDEEKQDKHKQLVKAAKQKTEDSGQLSGTRQQKADDSRQDEHSNEEEKLWFLKSLFQVKANWDIEDYKEDPKTTKAVLKEKIQKKLEEKTQIVEAKEINLQFPKDKPSFSIELLEKNTQLGQQIDEDYLIEKANAIKEKLNEFGIPVDIMWFNIGPTVIQIKIEPQAWIKISKIEGLKNDLALGLKTKSLRVLAPIPWTGSVWIEIPNPKPAMVRLRDILESWDFTKMMSKSLTNLSLWKWIDGNHVVKWLEDMPHLLVAWATWSGKSVWVNDFITSLIYQNTPSELKFIMVDPKQVELWIYEWIPYLLSPIITEPEKAVKVLRWAVNHMNERYQKLKKTKSRSISEYNEKVTEDERMYRIVIIIDELADLMMSGNKKDTELCISRIAQMARAVWMHLMLATQRPSVNVITWIIKANIPTRIAFWVVSQIDSRTILDSKWAEDLVWKWDMLYIDTQNKHPIRIQAPFITTKETENIVESIKAKYMVGLEEKDIYHPEIINILESKAETAGGGWEVNWDDEELVEQAMSIISETRKASATLLQRKLWIWFARAARIMDILEERWVVGPQEGAKPREILI